MEMAQKLHLKYSNRNPRTNLYGFACKLYLYCNNSIDIYKTNLLTKEKDGTKISAKIGQFLITHFSKIKLFKMSWLNVSTSNCEH